MNDTLNVDSFWSKFNFPTLQDFKGREKEKANARKDNLKLDLKRKSIQGKRGTMKLRTTISSDWSWLQPSGEYSTYIHSSSNDPYIKPRV